MSDSIIALAQQLGEAIADSPQAKNMLAAREAVEGESGTPELLQQFQQHSMKLAQLESENKPLEVADKQKLQALHEKLVASPAFKKLSSAQVEYADLMRRVSEAIQGRAFGAEDQDDSDQ